MSYTFIKVRSKIGKDKGKTHWLFKPKSLDQIDEHWVKYTRSVIIEGTQFLVRKKINRKVLGHCNNDFEAGVEALMYASGDNVIAASMKLENQVYTNRVTDLLRGREFYLNHGMQTIFIDDRITEIVETVEKDVLTFPDEEKPELSDVKYLVWDGGKHVYAKIGKIDVTDTQGRQKWDTREEAEKAAKEFIERNW